MPEDDQLASLKIERGTERRGASWFWLTIVVALAVVVSVSAWWWSRGPSVVEVRTAVVSEVGGDHDTTVLNASGYVTARRQATVSSKVTGRLVEVLIEEGMEVDQGDLMARLDDSNVRVNLELAESELVAAQTALEETRVRLEEAEIELSRARTLRERQINTQAELDRAQAEVDSLRARIEAQDDQVEVAERRLAVWRQELADREIRAPFAGVVVSKDAQPGEMVSPMTAGGGFTRTGIATIVDMSSLEIEVDVNESYINRVRPDQPVVATLDAYSDWQIPARVIAIVPTADRQRATVKVRIGFDELDPRILPDMGVKVAFRDTPVEAALERELTVPVAAVRESDGRDVVLVVRDGSLERRAVSIGETRDDEVVVLSGLSGGEVVVIEGPETLAEGDRVREVGR